MYRPPKMRRIWSHENQIFLKSHDFWQILLWFWTFSPKCTTFETCSHGWRQKIRGVYYRWLLIKTSQKRFFKKIVKKFFFVRFQQIFSPELKMLARFCKNQLRHQWIANDRPLWKRVRNFNFFRNIVIKFLNFDLNFEKFLKNFLKFKTRKILKLIFWPENCFCSHCGEHWPICSFDKVLTKIKS